MLQSDLRKSTGCQPTAWPSLIKQRNFFFFVCSHLGILLPLRSLFVANEPGFLSPYLPPFVCQNYWKKGHSKHIWTPVLKAKKMFWRCQYQFEDVPTCIIIFHDEGNRSRLHSKSQTLCIGLLHRRVVWSKHMDAHNEAIFGIRVFHMAVGLGKD